MRPVHHRARQDVRIGEEHGITTLMGQFSTELRDNASALRAHAQSDIVVAVRDEAVGSPAVEWGKCTDPRAKSRYCPHCRLYTQVRAGNRLEVYLGDRAPEDFLEHQQALALRHFVRREAQDAEAAWGADHAGPLLQPSRVPSVTCKCI